MDYYNRNFEHIPIAVYIRDVNNIQKSLTNLRELDFMKRNIAVLLYSYNISEKRLNVLSKMKRDAKYGFISQFLIKSARTIGLNEKIIGRYEDAKYVYTRRKSKYYNEGDKMESKRKLREETFFLVELCLSEFSTKKLREKKIESLLTS